MGRRASGQLLREANIVSANYFMSDNNNNKKTRRNGHIEHVPQAINTQTAEINFTSMHGYRPLAFGALLAFWKKGHDVR